MEHALLVKDLVKTYGRVRALDGLSFIAERGTVVALLGPNGAGKTTCLRILTTLARPDSGQVEVLGFDVVGQARLVRRAIGAAGQSASVDERLTGRENLVQTGRLSQLPRLARSTPRA